MSMNPPDPKSLVLENLQELQRAVGQLLGLLENQGEAIEQEDEVRLLKIIDEKQALIASLQAIEEKVAESMAGCTDQDTATLAVEAAGLQKDLENSFKKVAEMEESCRGKLEERKSKIQDKLMGLKKGKSVLRGYGAKPRKGPNISESI